VPKRVDGKSAGGVGVDQKKKIDKLLRAAGEMP